MDEALLALAGTVVCYGTATVLQDISARREERRPGLDAMLVARLLRQLPYLAGTALDALGFLLSLLALRQLPVFAVQAGVAASIGVTAILAALVLGERLRPRSWAVLALLFCGLIAVAGSAATEPARSPTAAIRGGLVAGVAALAALAWVGARQRGARSAVTLAAASGLAYGGVALAARLLSAGDGTFLVGDGLVRLLTDPLLWALLGYGALGLVTFAMALQRGPVTTVAAVVVVGETIAPALVGLALLGDRARPGLSWLAALGFAATVLGAWLLARFEAGRSAAQGSGAAVTAPPHRSGEVES